ncbi:pentatricopeptide repeat-containing protein At1g74600, chloroplastic [Beta vulgaris subsp. vulgaris]|uniref:pentatricopeptide repeat-containing protein At1g74600, chloroplastic n=1 Tax=Beta vulgaris subsp. vulgaris TaxID=3555 RepID=UPI00053F9533|nr:pentatricopeptide repeat-containing protein At1g74600, chloroplastic [Beta vulgaris subsp. vulgaris]
MNSLLHQISKKPKKPIYSGKFITSIAALNNPSNSVANVDAFPNNYIDPYQILASWKKSKLISIKNVKTIHTHLIKSANFHSDLFLINSLIDWYLKFSSIDDAVQLFDQMPSPNSISWNVVISGHNNNSLYDDAWRYFCRMRYMGYGSNQFTYGSVISACSGLGSLLYGKMVYSLTLKDGFFSNGYVRSGMIDLFAKNGRVEDAFRLFYDWPYEENVVCWNSMISGGVKNGDHGRAIELFNQMRQCAVIPNSFTFSGVLGACIALEDDDMGKKIHGLVIKHGAGEDVFVGTSISDLYSKCGHMDEAVKNFFRMPVQNVVSWTAMISGYVQKDDVVSALGLLREMRKVGVEVNRYTLTSILSACAKSNMVDVAMQMHSWIIKSGLVADSVVAASLISTYSKVGEILLSEFLYLEQDACDNQGVWTVMISSFAQNKNMEKAMKLFCKMLLNGMKPDNFSISSILSIIDCLYMGRQIHSYTLKTGLVFDLSVGSSLFTMYSKCDRLLESYEIFLELPVKDIVSWASMIYGFVEHGYSHKAIQLFREMLLAERKPDQITLMGVLTACSSLVIPLIGKEIHGYAFRAGLGGESLIGGALVNMYSKCGALDLARRVFDMILYKDQVMCSALVSGYAKSGYIREAFSVLRGMLVDDLQVDSYTFSSILGSDAILKRTNVGIQLHSLIIKLGLESDVSVGSSLVTMYSKWGVVNDCHKAFDQIIRPDLISWTTMIVSCAQHGKGAEALKLYEAMKSEGMKPDSVTFVGVLSACSHAGLVEEGYSHLSSMSKDYSIEPHLRHYACMVDLLGRSGRLKEAENFINNMPIKPDALVWGTLLAACKVHGNVELGRLAAQKVIDLLPSDPGAYISLSNLCADIGQWEEVEEIRDLMKGTTLSKEPGWSLV